MNKKPTSIDFKAIGKRVEKLRGNLNQTDFAIFFNATKSDISRIENGILEKPNFDLLSRICLYYGKNLDWLFSCEGDEPREVSYALPDDARAHRSVDGYTPEEELYLARLLDVLRCDDENLNSYVKRTIDLATTSESRERRFPERSFRIDGMNLYVDGRKFEFCSDCKKIQGKRKGDCQCEKGPSGKTARKKTT